MRPHSVDEVVGQSHVLGPGKLLRRAIESDRIQSLIFYGLLQRSLADAERGLGHLPIEADEPALRHLAKMADGDARKGLNALEIAALTTAPGDDGVIRITLAVAEESIQRKAIVYDGDE